MCLTGTMFIMIIHYIHKKIITSWIFFLLVLILTINILSVLSSSMEESTKFSLRIVHLLESGNSKSHPRLVRTLKIYFAISLIIITSCNIYVMAKYTLKRNGGIFNFQSLMHMTMQFCIIFCDKGFLTSEQVACYLSPETNVRLQNYKKNYFKYFSLVMAPIIASSIILISIYGPDEIYIMAFGIEGREVESFLGYFLLIMAFINVFNLISTIFIFSSRYIAVVYAIHMLARENLTFTRSLLIRCELSILNQEVFSRLEEMYLVYTSLVNEVDVIHGKVPLWCFMIIYVCIAAIGTFAVLSDYTISLASIIARSAAFLAVSLIFMLIVTRFCESAHTSMKQFRRHSLRLVNLQVKRSKMQEASCVCLTNTLRGVSLSKMKVAGMYDMEYSLFISLIGSAIPTTVMIVSLMNGVK